MNQHKTLFQSLKNVLMATLFMSGWEILAGPASVAASAPTNSQSGFIQPASPLDGRDPFYIRPHPVLFSLAVVPTSKTADLNWDLISLQGISGQPPQRLAIIKSKRTFSAGDNHGSVHF